MDSCTRRHICSRRSEHITSLWLPDGVWPCVCLSPRWWAHSSWSSASAHRLTILGAVVLVLKCLVLSEQMRKKPAACLGRWDQTETIRPTFRWPPQVTKGRGEPQLEESLLQPDIVFSWKRGPDRLSPRIYTKEGWEPRAAPCGGLWGATRGNAMYIKPQIQLILFQESSRFVWELVFLLYFYILGVINSLQLVNSKRWAPLQCTCHEHRIDKVHTGCAPQEWINSYSPEIESYLTSLGGSFLIFKGGVGPDDFQCCNMLWLPEQYCPIFLFKPYSFLMSIKSKSFTVKFQSTLNTVP